MLHWYCKVTIILKKNAKETIIVRRREYKYLDTQFKHSYLKKDEKNI